MASLAIGQARLHESLANSERQLQQLIDAVPVMIWGTTREGKPSYVNKRFTDVTGSFWDWIGFPCFRRCDRSRKIVFRLLEPG
jgi:PAS domain-containing protein